MLRNTNLASILSKSKYIKRYMDLNFEDHELSCFDLTLKQLNPLAYIDRTSDNQKSTRMVKSWGRIEKMKILKIHLQWSFRLARSGFQLCLALLQMLVGSEMDQGKVWTHGVSISKQMKNWNSVFKENPQAYPSMVRVWVCRFKAWS
jgi:hypothetical protein